MQPGPKPFDRYILYALLVLFPFAFYISTFDMIATLWTLDANGLSVLTSKFPYWDFTNYWAGGYLAWHGESTTIFDVLQYRTFLNTHFGVILAHHEWSYPPHQLLISAVLATMPIKTAYFVWTFSLWGLLLLFLRLRKLELKYLAIGLFCPAIMMNVMFGQNGALTAFLLLAGLYYSAKRPILGGILLGILTFKPHLCIMLPVVLLATRNWGAIAAASVTALGMMAVTTLWLGPEVWTLWHTQTMPFMVELLELPHPHPWMSDIITPFYTSSEFLPVDASYVLQWIVTVICAVVAWKLWRREDVLLIRKVALTGLLALLATPYAHCYDMVVSGIAVALLADLPGKRCRASLYALWVAPFLVGYFNLIGLVIAPLFIAAPLIACYPYRDGVSPWQKRLRSYRRAVVEHH